MSLQQLHKRKEVLGFSEEDYQKVKFAFKNENISAVVRDFLLSQAEQKLKDCNDMSFVEDVELQSFLSNPVVQKALFNVFKEV